MDKAEFFNYLLLEDEGIPNKLFHVFLIGHLSNSLVIIQKLERKEDLNKQELAELKIIYDILNNRKLLKNRFNFQNIERFSQGFDIKHDFLDIIEHIITNKEIDIKPEKFALLKDYMLFVYEIIYQKNYVEEIGLNAISIS
jgi:hypothetical protein